MSHADVIVVGAGPTGLYTAYRVAKAGYRVVVLEEHREVGVPVHCAGLVGYRSLRELNLYWDDIILNKVRGARIFSPSCKTILEVKRKSIQACVLDRERFDKKIYQKALSEGAEVVLERRAVDALVHDDSVKVLCSDRKYSAEVLVDAEGGRRKIAKRLGFKVPSKGILPAIQAEFKGVHDIEMDVVEIYLGRKWARGLFGWLIPTSENSARIGLASTGSVVHRFNHMIRFHPILKNRLNKAKITRLTTGFVITHGPLKRTCKNRVLLVGDAAGHVKPTTGGGIVYGIKGACVASRVIINTLSRDTTVCVYDKLWRREFGRKLKFMLLIRRVLDLLDDNTLERIMLNLKEYYIENTLVAYGDMDEQHRIIKGFVKNPLILFAMLRTLVS